MDRTLLRRAHLLGLSVVLSTQLVAEQAAAQASHGAPSEHAHAGVARLTFVEALELALERPEARGPSRVRAARAVADGDVHRLAGNPSVQVQVGRRRVPRADVGPEVQATIVQGFPLGRLGAARLAALASELRALDVEQRVERMWAALEGGDAWLALHAAEQRLEVAHACVALGEQHLAVVSRAQVLRLATDVDVSEATGALGALRLEVTQADDERRAASLALLHATAQHDQGLHAATLGAPPDVAVPPVDELLGDPARFAGFPTLALHEALVAAEVARAREVERATRGVGALGVYVERDSPRGIVLAGVFQATFGFVDRNGRGRAEAAERVARAEVQAVRAQHEAHGMFQAAIDAVELTERARLTHAAEVITALEARAQQLARRLALGAGTRAEVLRADLALAQGRITQGRLDEAAARARLRLRLLLDAAGSEDASAERFVAGTEAP
ncbi:MAG: hypothetical protein R3B40_28445 [Polyangiales bacterium]|nr:hypothetical protein [Myxococcales bacterium]MCB9656110.1 hypothetical protein [Sandaracinaceae bacterium]